MGQTRYMALREGGHYSPSGCDFDDFVREVNDFSAETGFVYVAWAEYSLEDPAILRAESIAAGRLIELVDGKYVARGVPAEEVKEASSADKLIYEAITQAYFASKTPALDKLANTAEPQRERLTWAAATPFDPWKDYEVTSHTNEARKQPLSPLQRHSEGERIPGFGSAALLKVR
jgi:hypothetical protein